MSTRRAGKDGWRNSRTPSHDNWRHLWQSRAPRYLSGLLEEDDSADMEEVEEREDASQAEDHEMSFMAHIHLEGDNQMF